MSGIILVFVGAPCLFVNFLLGTIAVHYNLVNFATNVSSLYVVAAVLAILGVWRMSRQSRVDSTDILMHYAVIFGLICSLTGLISPFILAWLTSIAMNLDQHIYALFQ